MSREENAESSYADSDSGFEEVAQSDEDTDIFSSLTGAGKVSRRDHSGIEGEDEEDFIRDSMARKRAKDGTELLKKMKGKAKLVKGEIGGGSFQSMGEFFFATSKSSVYSYYQ
jgi:ATP-dependent RNA helicase DDX54/DBP10